jgi:uncharacterized protein (TIGR03086 family)
MAVMRATTATPANPLPTPTNVAPADPIPTTATPTAGAPTAGPANITPPLSVELQDDPRAVFARAVSIASTAIAAVRPDQLTDPTPCEEYDVERLLGHLVGLMRRVAAMGRGEDPMTVPSEAERVEPDAWLPAWTSTTREVQDAWADDATLTCTIVLPWATMLGGATLATYTNEVSVHTWDLAVATGQAVAWDPAVLEVALDAVSWMPADHRLEEFDAVVERMPVERRPSGPPFAEAVAVPADAPIIDRLVAWNGRDPQRT